MIHKIIFEVVSAWQVVIVGLIFVIILPIVFYFASFDKNPVKINKVPVKKKGTEPANQSKGKAKPAKEEKNKPEEADDEIPANKGKSSRQGAKAEEEPDDDIPPAKKKGSPKK